VSGSSGFGENLDRQGLVAERKGKHPRSSGSASAASATAIFGRFEERRSAVVVADAPGRAATTYECPDGELATGGSVLDVAVWKTKYQDRRVGHAKTVPGPADAGY
jgi:hypothetical protein